MFDKTICPDCHESVIVQPNGTTDADGHWELECHDCPICGHVFSGKEIKACRTA